MGFILNLARVSEPFPKIQFVEKIGSGHCYFSKYLLLALVYEFISSRHKLDGQFRSCSESFS